MLANGLFGFHDRFDPPEPRVTFWKKEDSWPQDAGGYIFAARAIRILGTHIFSDTWSDQAPATQLTWELPKHLHLDTPRHELDRGIRLLKSYDSRYRRRCPNGLVNVATFEFPTSSEWAEAVERSRKLRDESWNSFAPFFRTAAIMERACLDGVIRTATRAPLGGAFTCREWDFWNSEQAWQRFDLCRVVADQPFAPAKPDEPFEWLFVEESTLRNFMNQKSEDDTPPKFEEADAAKLREREQPKGRKPNRHWDAITAEAFRMAHEDGIPESDREFARRLTEWAAEHFDEEAPSENTIRAKVAAWLKAIRIGE